MTSNTNNTVATTVSFEVKEGDVRQINPAVRDAIIAARLVAAHTSFAKYDTLTRMQVQQVANANVGHTQALHTVVRIAAKHPLRYEGAVTELLAYLDQQTQAIEDRDDRLNTIRLLFGLPQFTKTAAQRYAERVAATTAAPEAKPAVTVAVPSKGKGKGKPAPATTRTSSTPKNITVEEEVALLRAKNAALRAELAAKGIDVPVVQTTPATVTAMVAAPAPAKRTRKAKAVVAAEQRGEQVVYASASDEIEALLRGAGDVVKARH